MALAGQPASRSSEGFAVEGEVLDPAAGAAPFFRAPAACWWARTWLESTLIVDSAAPTESSLTTTASRIRSQVPVRGRTAQAFVGGLPRSVTFGQVASGGTGAQFPQDRVDHLAVIAPSVAVAGHLGQQGFDPGPGLVGQLAASHHRPMITNGRWGALQDTSYAVHTACTDHRIRAVGTVVPGEMGTSFRSFHPEGAAIALDAMARARTEEIRTGELTRDN
jgi:hypothetical protein